MAVSVHLPVARSAQQLSFMATLILAGVAASLLEVLGAGREWPAFLLAEAVVFVLACLALAASVRMFRRDSFFERR